MPVTLQPTSLKYKNQNGTFQSADAIKGDAGVSPTVSVTDITGGHRVTVTDVDGAHTFDVMDGEVSQAEFDELESEIDNLYDLMPSSGATDWESYTFTVTSGYIDKSGVAKSSQYAEWTLIVWDGSTSYKITGKVPNNATILPVVYADLNDNVLGYETSIEGTTVTNHVLTIPSGTAKIYINWTPVSPSNPNTMQSKAASAYVKAAAESALDEKMDAPVGTGTSGQVLTSDGSGGASWQSIPVDATLTESGKPADAKVTGDRLDAIDIKMPFVYESLSLTTVDNKYMQLNLTERAITGYSYTYITFESDKKYRVSTESACNQYLAPVIYVDGEGGYAGQYPTETSGSNVTLDDELLNIPSGSVGMYVNHVGSNTPLKVLEGGITNIAPAVDYTQHTWNAIGDSITYNGRYEDEVKSIIGLPYTNGGVSGSTLAINDTYMTGQSIVERVLADTYSDADIWTVMGGLNDCLYKSPLGALAVIGSTFDKTTVYGALQAICEYILNLRAHPCLILITPTQSVRDGWSAETYPTTMAQIRQAVIDVAEYYSVTCFDAWGKSGISAYNIQKATNPTTSDGVHLNTLGADILGEKLALALKDELFGINDD